MPRNIYGVTKLTAENLCRLYAQTRGLNAAVLRTARFFPEDDDTHATPSGENLKANELLHRRLTVEDAADAHIAALHRAPQIGFGTFILSAPTPFTREHARALKEDASAVIACLFPEAPALYAAKGWSLPRSIGRVYDSAHAEEVLGFRCATSFADVMTALREGQAMPFTHDPAYLSPKER
jgi:nucleoside-diphosphate-sugar epimerase